VAAFLFSCGWYDLAFGKDHFFIYLFFQGAAFFIVGIGYVGTIVPQS
jgi:beta-mannan synthase